MYTAQRYALDMKETVLRDMIQSEDIKRELTVIPGDSVCGNLLGVAIVHHWSVICVMMS